MGMKRCVAGIDPRTVLHSDVFVCHEWRRRCTKGRIRSRVNGLEERCVKEGGKERYCWRAGVMSRDEKEEEEELFV